MEDNPHMFKKLANNNPPMYDVAPNLKAFEEWKRGMKKLSDALQCPEEWRVGVARFYLSDEADFWWATLRQH